ncbi:A/G-specific adenine glycosylase [Sphingoaurantiacus capsulatus]|uniref:Adenine DNA glycosylase n=1 Tax=Sphingoaurantiacus capsulatus TaxID=1771310 RepID=A0ABV7XFV1_9SPHN
MPVDSAAREILAWYDANARAMPWRRAPGANVPVDPYRVWLSEVMLQQTTVAMATPYFEKFTGMWPTVEALASAEDAAVMSAWAGLGYYARARNLLACARAVAERGGFPGSEAELLTLPGVGPYTAAAVASIAFDEAAPVVDGNVERVMSRLFAVETPLPAGKRELRAHAAALTPTMRPGDYAQAVMDLGATICTPKKPRCGACPWQGRCAAFAAGNPERYPLKAPRAARPTRYGTAWWIEAEGHVLLVRRPPKGLLGGMVALPASEFALERVEGGAPVEAAWSRVPEPVRHAFTHFDLVLDVAAVRLPRRPDVEGEWHPIATIDAAGLPTLFRRAADAAMTPCLL